MENIENLKTLGELLGYEGNALRAFLKINKIGCAMSVMQSAMS